MSRGGSIACSSLFARRFDDGNRIGLRLTPAIFTAPLGADHCTVPPISPRPASSSSASKSGDHSSASSSRYCSTRTPSNAAGPDPCF